MFYRVAKTVVGLYLRLLFRVEVTGELPKAGGCLICPNHTSYYDPAVVAAFSNRPLTFMAKQELFSSPVFGWL
ncbi:MAG: 1-acyl-sn-glycerol-3-phosphate acyltransferase, partial [Ruminococcaceae bacterium]|nr:1-acyl-sn-glycerol-3-phosphate acyltransferase [Oscillospiraceae bacterium]